MKDIFFSEAIREALSEEMRRDENVFLLGEDIGIYGGAFGVTKGLFEEFGSKRVRDTPMSESAITGVAAGAALGGARPVVEIMFMDFLTLALDQILNHMSKFRYMYNGQFKVPVVIRLPSGAGRGYGCTHSQTLESWLLNIPGIKIVVPSTPYDAKGLLKTAIRDDNPVVFIENKLLYGTKEKIPEEEYAIPFGKAIVRKKGTDVTIVTYSRMCILALEAANDLEKENIHAEIIDLRMLKPLDITTIVESVKKTGKVIIIEEGYKTGGVGAEITSQIITNAFDYLDAPIKRLAAADVPISCCPVLENISIPTKNSIITEIKKLKNV